MYQEPAEITIENLISKIKHPLDSLYKRLKMTEESASKLEDSFM